MRARLEAYVDQLIAEEQYDEKESVWTFPNGDHCWICTNSAVRIAKEFKGTVWGYWGADNPIALIGWPHYEGHDFAIIQKRWLVDYWAFRISKLSPVRVFDLRRVQERQLVKTLYGSKERWNQGDSFERRSPSR